ncbi:MAG: hypothetical protein V3T30_00580, partial [Thermodesulfobacteriota bacterium]
VTEGRDQKIARKVQTPAPKAAVVKKAPLTPVKTVPVNSVKTAPEAAADPALPLAIVPVKEAPKKKQVFEPLKTVKITEPFSSERTKKSPQDLHRLAVRARALTWMRVTVDDEPPVEMTLKRGERAEWTGKVFFYS